MLADMDPLDELRHNRALAAQVKERQRYLDDQRQTLVAAAFDAGHTGPEVAQAARCSKERAYQLRDGGRR